ncbi:family 16 glycosylhydrolase [Eubacterium ruminantium]|uniref:family 16 glycosylhydrolase n=1 Tax=Eubacterium ruminantium TaxID=42322 RepID=UPI0015685911|nr:family 16 glycosylhydrolase [Eubacterium ruminantium]
MRKKSRKLATLFFAALMAGSALGGCGKKSNNNNENSSAPATSDNTVTESTETSTVTVNTPPSTDVTEEDVPVPAGYHLVWHDEFNGTELNPDDWNYETHEAGWVNHELQEYVPSTDYAYVKDGELVIQPVKTVDENGNTAYFSGRVNTQNKHDYKYGKVEARLKVPTGKGFLPAFWMMPQDEQFYGQWPRCGEIDIMEVLGDSTNTLYGTLHFGEPHKQRQGTFTLTEGNFAEEYHTFAIEWEPGEIRWYCDDVQYFATNDWFTKAGGQINGKPYPAPFNQPFHVILNVAVGGDWPGNPDDTTPFDERASMKVDYVRFYQKESYDENVEKPVDKLVMREADENGNFIYNGDFSENEDLSDDENWKFILLAGGDGKAEIKNNEIIISSNSEGTEEYSVQLVQPQMPMEKGARYRLSFEACSEEPRQMKIGISAPDVDWIRYFKDTTVELTEEWQEYSFEFKMTEESDDNGRVEFNMGKQGSTATIHIKNVRLEKIEE